MEGLREGFGRNRWKRKYNQDILNNVVVVLTHHVQRVLSLCFCKHDLSTTRNC